MDQSGRDALTANPSRSAVGMAYNDYVVPSKGNGRGVQKPMVVS